jgi:hypothetical protein
MGHGGVRRRRVGVDALTMGAGQPWKLFLHSIVGATRKRMVGTLRGRTGIRIAG